MNASIIPPKILRGTRDFLPEEMAKRQYVMEIIRKVFIRFGYDTIETPAIEYLETLTGSYGDEGNKLMYKFEDNGGRKIALRYDQTVPMARLVAANYKNLPMPFKRYQISRVWRADRPAKGRYREFYQCDADVIGTNSLVADAEIAKLLFAIFSELGFQNFVLKWNSRKLMNSILESFGIPSENQMQIIRVMDKLEKIGRKEIQKELEEYVSAKKVKKLLDSNSMDDSNTSKREIIKKYKVEEIEEFLALCQNFDIPEERLQLDLSLARGLDYYTGIVYEGMLPDVDIGSVCGGGRYDDLCSRFCKEKFSGTGFALGFDRILVAMEKKEFLKNIGLSSQVLVTYFDKTTLSDSVRILSTLQSAGIPSEIYYEEAKLGKQMKYANKKQIPFVLFCGPEEVQKSEVKIKMMQTGTEKSIPENQLISYFKGLSRTSS